MKRIAEHRTPLLLFLFLLFINSLSADLTNPYKKPIGGDAKGYYAYLPAIFIYHDFDYNFMAQIEQTYYDPSTAKDFVKEVNGEKVNKTFPGVAILYLPFFLIAHAISLLFGLPADGYAYTYQLLFISGFWFYFLLGMICFKKVLIELNFTKKIADLSLVICVLGTNIVFYTLYDSSVTHIYNFFLVNLSILLLLQIKRFTQDNPSLRNQIPPQKLFALFSLLAIIGITRPTNFLIVLVLLFFVPNRVFYINLLKSILSLKSVFKSLFAPLIVLSIPLILWKLQTGNWIVYSYGEEGFNFSQPEIFNFLFSYTKGWFLYTPIALLIIIFGVIILLKSDKEKAIILIVFLCFSVYIFSSWWCWYYGAGMSQRVMIDYTIVLGFLLALILQNINLKPYLKTIFLLLSLLLIGLNIVQAYQTSIGILPNGSPTKEQYWDNFLSTEKKAKIYPQKHWKLIDKQTISLDPKNNQVIKGSSYFIQDNWQINVSDTNQYSPVFRVNSSPIKKGSKLIFSFDVKATTELDLTRFVVTLSNGETPVFFLKEYSHLYDWVRMEFLFEPLTKHDPIIDLYFWNAGSLESAEIKNVQFFHYYSDEYF